MTGRREVSQVSPPSSEKACSQRGVGVVTPANWTNASEPILAKAIEQQPTSETEH